MNSKLRSRMGMTICSLVRCLWMFTSFEKERTFSYETNGKRVARGRRGSQKYKWVYGVHVHHHPETMMTQMQVLAGKSLIFFVLRRNNSLAGKDSDIISWIFSKNFWGYFTNLYHWNVCGPALVVFFILGVICSSVMYTVDNYKIIQLYGSFKFTWFFFYS